MQRRWSSLQTVGTALVVAAIYVFSTAVPALALYENDQGHKHQDRVRDRARGEAGQFPEHQGQDDHRQERSNDGPGKARDGLFVADDEIAPAQVVKQMPRLPQVLPVPAL